MYYKIFQGIMIPFIGTSAGAAMVFLLKKRISEMLQRILTGFAAGVMVAASFWRIPKIWVDWPLYLRLWVS